MSLRHFALPALAATAIATAGCGEGSKGGSTGASGTTATASTVASSATATTTVKVATGRPLTHATFIAKGDAICALTNTKLNATPVNSNAEFVRAMPQAAAYYSTEFDQLSKLVPPTSLAHDWAHVLALAHLMSESAGRFASYLTAYGDSSSAQPLLSALESARGHFVAANRHIGFKRCSVG